MGRCCGGKNAGKPITVPRYLAGLGVFCGTGVLSDLCDEAVQVNELSLEGAADDAALAADLQVLRRRVRLRTCTHARTRVSPCMVAFWNRN